MDFRATAEQEMLRQSARRFLPTTSDAGGVDEKAAPRMQCWRLLAEMGWLTLTVPEAAGGLGGTLEEFVILSEEMGRSLSTEPFIDGAILPAGVLGRCRPGEQRDSLLSMFGEGRARVAVALYEPGRRYALYPELRAVRRTDGSYCLSGGKVLVAGGAQADRLIVSARPEEGMGGPLLLLVGTEQAGVNRRTYETIDGATAADFVFDKVRVPAHGVLATEAAAVIVEEAVEDAIICSCASALGCMDRAIELTVDYLKLRKQFGRPLADFQSLQHSVAELFIEAEGARSMVYRAIASSSLARAERRRAVSGCFVKVMNAAKRVAGDAVHLHGGIGMTCEYPVGHYLRRAIVAERMFGDREHYLAGCLDPS